MNPEDAVKDYRYAYQLIEDIKSQGDFCVGAACYPKDILNAAVKWTILTISNKSRLRLRFFNHTNVFDNQILYNFCIKLWPKESMFPLLRELCL